MLVVDSGVVPPRAGGVPLCSTQTGSARRPLDAPMIAIPAGELVHASLSRLNRFVGVAAIGSLLPVFVASRATTALDYHRVCFPSFIAGRSRRFRLSHCDDLHVSIVMTTCTKSREKCSHVYKSLN